MRYTLLFSATLLLIGSPVASAQTASPAQRLEDLRRATAVRLALLDDARTRGYDLGIQTADGTVVLSGLVPTLGARAEVEAVVREVRGVRVIRNDLRLTSAPDEPILGPTESPAADPIAPTETAQPTNIEEGEPREVYHVVQQDDTLYSLARRYGTSVDELLRLNGLSTPSIAIGQRIRVR